VGVEDLLYVDSFSVDGVDDSDKAVLICSLKWSHALPCWCDKLDLIGLFRLRITGRVVRCKGHTDRESVVKDTAACRVEVLNAAQRD
jgi:hypothetical protein